MKTLSEQLTMYAKYHRDPRNIATHFVGIPMIVVAIAILLAKPSFMVAGVLVSPALLLVVGSSIYYLKLSLALGVLMSVLFALTIYVANTVAEMSTQVWLAWGVGLFVIGWVVQFFGHYYEGKKPAFIDDLSGLLIGPLFIVCELLFVFGMLQKTREVIERDAGEIRHQTGPQAKAS